MPARKAVRGVVRWSGEGCCAALKCVVVGKMLEWQPLASTGLGISIFNGRKIRDTVITCGEARRSIDLVLLDIFSTVDENAAKHTG